MKDTSIRAVAYKTFVRPILAYSSPVWSAYTKPNIRRIEMTQMRAALWTLCRRFSNMFGELGWKSLEDRRTDTLLYQFYNSVHGLFVQCYASTKRFEA